jgi:RNA 2',3'-cyclic 3'-phosphodiesterase
MPHGTPAAAGDARLFLALWPSPSVRAALASAAGQWVWPAQARRVSPQRLHVTLHFLGKVPRERIAVLVQGLSVPVAPFRLSIDRAAVWRNGVALLQPAAVPVELLHLHEMLARSLPALGLAAETRRFRPHVTLAREAGGATPPPLFTPIAWRVAHFALVESQWGAQAAYRVLHRFG